MSVTFSVDSVSTGRYHFSCYPSFEVVGEKPSPRVYPSLVEAEAAAIAHYEACVDCSDFGMPPLVDAEQDVDLWVNFSNTNASMLLGILGLRALNADGELCGSMAGSEFLGYCLVALGQERNDAAVPAADVSTGVGARVIDCGLPEGYVSTSLGRLADVASEAARLGRHVTWA
jgi:hypothetical protein